MTVAYSYLLFIVLGIFLFCYFVATRVWIKVDKKINNSSSDKEQIAEEIFFIFHQFQLVV